MTTFELPDALATAPPATFEFHDHAATEADMLLTADPGTLYRRLLRDQESEAVLMAARRILHGFLSRPGNRTGRPSADPEAVADWIDQFRDVIAALLADLSTITDAAAETVLRQRAPLALLGGCWLDAVSQPATQPAAVTTRLLQQQFVLRGEGDPRRGLHHLRREALAAAGVYLPEITAADFLRTTEARPLTSIHGAFYLSLARLPANFLPEVVGVHYAVTALGLDDRLLGMRPALAESELRAMLTDYLATAPELGERVVRGMELAATLELEHAGMLAHLAGWRDGRLGEIPNRVGDQLAAAWLRTLDAPPPRDIVLGPADAPDHRRFLHRLVNIENYPNTRTLAREHAGVILGIAEEALFSRGELGVLTDASWFDYTPDALRERVDRTCRDKDRLSRHAGPAAVALAGLTTGACAHRVGAVGRYTRPSDGALCALYAREMGVGGPNQVAESYRQLGAMGVRVPHIGDTAFLDEDVARDFPCELAIHQLCLSLFPDTFYEEILGFQLGVTTAGLGEAAVEDAVAIVVDHLDGVRREGGADAVRARWRRIWRGYASFAYLVEPEPLGGMVVETPTESRPRQGTPAWKDLLSMYVDSR